MSQDEHSGPPTSDLPPDDPAPAGPPAEAERPAPPRQPLWTTFLTPAAVLIGAVLVAAAILVVGGDGDGDDTVVPAAPDSSSSTVDPTPAGVASEPTTLRDLMVDYAQAAGLDEQAFGQCFDEFPGLDTINAHLQRGSTVGVQATPSFAINDKLVVGAQPAAVFEEIIDAELSGDPPDSVEDYSATIQQLADSDRFRILDQPVDVSDAPMAGDPDAEVVVAEFSDFQCPFCRRWHDEYGASLRERAGDEIAVAFLHFPLQQIHPNAPFASVAADCALRQDAFWEMHDILFARQGEWQDAPR